MVNCFWVDPELALLNATIAISPGFNCVPGVAPAVDEAVGLGEALKVDVGESFSVSVGLALNVDVAESFSVSVGLALGEQVEYGVDVGESFSVPVGLALGEQGGYGGGGGVA